VLRFNKSAPYPYFCALQRTAINAAYHRLDRIELRSTYLVVVARNGLPTCTMSAKEMIPRGTMVFRRRQRRKEEMTSNEYGNGPASDAEAVAHGNGHPIIEVDDIDLIPPSRLEVVRQRIEVVEAYLALDPPTARAAVEGADRLGVALSTFYALARTWRENGRPTDLNGSGYRASPRKRRVIGDEHFIEEALKTLPFGPTVESDVTALVRLAAEKGVKLRAISSLRRKVRELRPEHRETIGADLALGRTAIDLPVQSDDGPILPVACVLTDERRSRILAAHLTLEAEGDHAAIGVLTNALLNRRLVDAIPGAEPVARAIARGTGVLENECIVDVLESHGLSVVEATPAARTRVNFHIARLLTTIGLKGLPRMGGWARARRATVANGRLNAAISLHEAQALIDARLARLPNDPVGLPAAKSAISLALALGSEANHD
jgi:hypothetical protein